MARLSSATTAAAIAALDPDDVDGYFAYEELFGRIRRALRDLDQVTREERRMRRRGMNGRDEAGGEARLEGTDVPFEGSGRAGARTAESSSFVAAPRFTR